MERSEVKFRAKQQVLTFTGGIRRYASDTVNYVEACFDLQDNWNGFDAVTAVWNNGTTRISTVLDSNGKCRVPQEVLCKRGDVFLNLTGTTSANGTVTERLTSYPVWVLAVDAKAHTRGAETAEITPSQFEQFASNVRADASSARASATAAAASASASAQSASDAAQSAAGALNFNRGAMINAEQAHDSKMQAEESAQDAETYAQQASTSEQNASNSAENAFYSATQAREASESAGASAEQASESAQSASTDADRAETARAFLENVSATATTLAPGSQATASYDGGMFSFGIPQGAKGDKGDTGATGAKGDAFEYSDFTPAQLEALTGPQGPQGERGEKGEQGDVSLSQLEALLPTDTASGSIVTITDGQAVVPAKSLKVALEPIQSGSGTPSPDNVRPISGYDSVVVTQRTGKNLLNPSLYKFQTATRNGLTYTVNNDGTISVTGTVTATGGPSLTDYFYLPAGTYSFIEETSQNVYCAYRRIPSGQSSSSALASPFTTDGNDRIYINLYSKVSSGNIDLTIHPQIEAGSTSSEFEPYEAETYTTSLGRTVYGGTLDVVTGELVMDRAMVDLGTLDFSYDSGGKRWQIAMPDIYNYPSRNANLVAEKYVADITASAGNEGKMFTVGKGLYIYSVDGTTPPSGNLVYPIATPQTIQLTPQEVQLLLGTNNVWSDGDVTMTYNADIQRYIEKKLS